MEVPKWPIACHTTQNRFFFFCLTRKGLEIKINIEKLPNSILWLDHPKLFCLQSFSNKKVESGKYKKVNFFVLAIIKIYSFILTCSCFLFCKFIALYSITVQLKQITDSYTSTFHSRRVARIVRDDTDVFPWTCCVHL